MLRTALRTLGRTSVRSARLPSAAPAAVVVVSTRMYTDNILQSRKAMIRNQHGKSSTGDLDVDLIKLI